VLHGCSGLILNTPRHLRPHISPKTGVRCRLPASLHFVLSPAASDGTGTLEQGDGGSCAWELRKSSVFSDFGVCQEVHGRLACAEPLTCSRAPDNAVSSFVFSQRCCQRPAGDRGAGRRRACGHVRCGCVEMPGAHVGRAPFPCQLFFPHAHLGRASRVRGACAAGGRQVRRGGGAVRARRRFGSDYWQHGAGAAGNDGWRRLAGARARCRRRCGGGVLPDHERAPPPAAPRHALREHTAPGLLRLRPPPSLPAARQC
jgi:hypothetical protein